MTLPSVTNDLLMLPPSFSLWPLVPAASARSLQSQHTSVPYLTCGVNACS